jgi:hypothetical protein
VPTVDPHVKECIKMTCGHSVTGAGARILLHEFADKVFVVEL